MFVQLLQKAKGSGALRTGSVAFEAALWQNLDQLYDKGSLT